VQAASLRVCTGRHARGGIVCVLAIVGRGLDDGGAVIVFLLLVVFVLGLSTVLLRIPASTTMLKHRRTLSVRVVEKRQVGGCTDVQEKESNIVKDSTAENTTRCTHV
jgi:hypothetical protein